MSYPAYRKGIVDCESEVDLSKVKGKSVVVTGGMQPSQSSDQQRESKNAQSLMNTAGAKGMGEEAVRAFAKAG